MFKKNNDRKHENIHEQIRRRENENCKLTGNKVGDALQSVQKV